MKADISISFVTVDQLLWLLIVIYLGPAAALGEALKNHDSGGELTNKAWKQVPREGGFPDVHNFYTKYAAKGLPVVFSTASSSINIDEIRLSRLNISGLAALSFVGDSKRRISLRHIAQKQNSLGSLAISESLHNNLKTVIQLPRCLQCSNLVALFLETQHSIILTSSHQPARMENSESLLCIVDGKKRVVLLDARENPTAASRALEQEEETPLTERPELYSAHLMETILEAGDCLYVPSSWIEQAQTIGLENSVVLRWSADDWSPDEDCVKNIGKSSPLSVYSFPGEGYRGVVSSLDRRAKVLAKTTHILDMLARGEQFNLAQFRALLARDGRVVEKLQEWTGECSERAAEMFQLLDTSSDGQLNTDDLEIAEQQTSRLLGYMDDRLADWEDIVVDQRLDRGFANDIVSEKHRIELAKAMLRDEL